MCFLERDYTVAWLYCVAAPATLHFDSDACKLLSHMSELVVADMTHDFCVEEAVVPLDDEVMAPPLQKLTISEITLFKNRNN